MKPIKTKRDRPRRRTKNGVVSPTLVADLVLSYVNLLTFLSVEQHLLGEIEIRLETYL